MIDINTAALLIAKEKKKEREERKQREYKEREEARIAHRQGINGVHAVIYSLLKAFDGVNDLEFHVSARGVVGTTNETCYRLWKDDKQIVEAYPNYWSEQDPASGAIKKYGVTWVIGVNGKSKSLSSPVDKFAQEFGEFMADYI